MVPPPLPALVVLVGDTVVVPLQFALTLVDVELVLLALPEVVDPDDVLLVDVLDPELLFWVLELLTPTVLVQFVLVLELLVVVIVLFEFGPVLEIVAAAAMPTMALILSMVAATKPITFFTSFLLYYAPLCCISD